MHQLQLSYLFITKSSITWDSKSFVTYKESCNFPQKFQNKMTNTPVVLSLFYMAKYYDKSINSNATAICRNKLVNQDNGKPCNSTPDLKILFWDQWIQRFCLNP